MSKVKYNFHSLDEPKVVEVDVQEMLDLYSHDQCELLQHLELVNGSHVFLFYDGEIQVLVPYEEPTTPVTPEVCPSCRTTDCVMANQLRIADGLTPHDCY